jgi:hypothetical protein
MWEALREAVDEEMEADPTVCMMGEAELLGILPATHQTLLPYELPRSKWVLQERMLVTMVDPTRCLMIYTKSMAS